MPHRRQRMLSSMGNNISEQTSRSAHGDADELAMRTGDSHTRIAEAAARLARKLHTGQKDKAGQDYFDGHLSTVAKLGNNWKEQTVGYLHDTAEDTPCTVDEIILTLKTECPDMTQAECREIADALNLMNSRTAPCREAYIRRFRGHSLAIRVKLNDLRHNMDISRIPHPTDNDMARVERYKKEYETLSRMLEECARR